MAPVRTTTKKLYSSIRNSICDEIGNTPESESIARLLLEHYLDLSYTEILLDRDILVIDELNHELLAAVDRLNRGEPIQYILGYTYFLGRKFIVNSSVLIPRPETEELVRHIVMHDSMAHLSILDIGTGSGCIAISLKKELANPLVHAIDIDREVLKIATLNAEKLDAEVFFMEKDILQATSLPQKYDIIVSNPPYVLESEKGYMKANVLDYEPSKALFVPTHDPLIFYRKIVELARESLKPQGRIYLEINEGFGEELSNLLRKSGFVDVNIHKDIHNKDRIVEGFMGLE